MIAKRPGKSLPRFACPAGRLRQAKKDVARGPLRRFAAGACTDAVKQDGGAQNAAERGLAEPRGAAGAGQSIKKVQREAGGLGDTARMRVRCTRGGAETSLGSGFHVRIAGKAGAPFLPEAGVAQSALPVVCDALFALGGDSVPHGFSRCEQDSGGGLFQERVEHGEILEIAEEILNLLQFVFPGCVHIRKQILDRIAEAFEADAQGVPRLGLLDLEGARVEFVRFLVTLEGEALRGEAAGRDEARTVAKRAGEALPSFLVKALGGAEDAAAGRHFAFREKLEEPFAHGVAFPRELLDAVLEDLPFAQRAEGAEQFPRELPHFAPGRMEVHFLHGGGKRAAAANGNAGVVDGIGVGVGADVLQLFQGSVHPKGKTETLRRRAGRDGDHTGHRYL